MSKINYSGLLEKISITDVAKKLGMELRGENSDSSKTLCPFHDDTNPSMLLYTAREQGRQHYYCFACGAHGDAIDLVKEKLQLNFREAVEWIIPGTFRAYRSSRRNDGAPVIADPENDGLRLGYEKYRKLNNEEMLSSWISERGLAADTIRRANFSWTATNALSRSLDKGTDANVQREQVELLEAAQLIRKLRIEPSESSSLDLVTGAKYATRYRDFFVGERIVFPVFSDTKDLVGLAGRRSSDANDKGSPKYQFTQGFPKASVLYRAEYAFPQIRQRAKNGEKRIDLFICEGFLDALRLESLGFPAVAIMGSVISDKQVQLLNDLNLSLPTKQSVVTINLCFDRDEAGLRGAADAYLKLAQVQPDCRFIWPLEEIVATKKLSKDPNDYLADMPMEVADRLLRDSSFSGVVAVISSAIGVTADDAVDESKWENTPRTLKVRAFLTAYSKISKAVGNQAKPLINNLASRDSEKSAVLLREWAEFLRNYEADSRHLISTDFLTNKQARLNHARILAYMGSQRGELPCDESRWERLSCV